MNEVIKGTRFLDQEFSGEDFVSSALVFVKGILLWEKGFQTIQAEGINDRVFLSYPYIFGRILATQVPNSKPKHLDGEEVKSLYEAFLLDFLGVVKFEHQRQMQLDMKAGIHYEGLEARSIRMLESKVEGEIKRVRKISQKISLKPVPFIRSSRLISLNKKVSGGVERITRK